MELIKIFIGGGLVCIFGEILWANTKMGVVKSLMLCICIGAAISAMGIIGPVIGFAQEGIMVTIFGSGASIFDGVWGSVQENGIAGLLELTHFYFLRFAGVIAVTMVIAVVCGFFNRKDTPEL